MIPARWRGSHGGHFVGISSRAAAILLGLAPRKICAAQAPPIAAATVTANRLHDFEEQFEEGAGLASVAASVTASVAA